MKNRNIVIAYLIITLIFLSEIVLNFNKYSYSGYYTDKIINWVWLVMTVFIIIWFWKKKVIKVYFSLLVLGIVLSILPMMIPFFMIVNYFSTFDNYQRIQLDDVYRIESGRPGALSKPQVTVYKREGILEKPIYTTHYKKIIEGIFELTPDSPAMANKKPIQKAKLVSVSKDSMGIEYQILNKKKIFYHKNNEDWFDDL
ncbi:hypothetical protein [Chryseobacterium sp. SIMBA_028]|uniref:hypothetical protein n=1 Tax=Chryseobacterium sp. SIMBA_028 TaxID=3085771 RepID=UPI00397B69CC